MGFPAKGHISIHGRLLGIQALSSGETGRAGSQHALTGSVLGFRNDVTNETTASNLRPAGFSVCATGSSAVMTIDAPVPGLEKVIYSSGGSTSYVKSAGSETFESSRGSTFTVMRFQQIGVVRLMGLTTARWLIAGAIDSTAVVALTTTT